MGLQRLADSIHGLLVTDPSGDQPIDHRQAAPVVYSQDVLERDYDQRTKREKMEQRRQYLDRF